MMTPPPPPVVLVVFVNRNEIEESRLLGFRNYFIINNRLLGRRRTKTKTARNSLTCCNLEKCFVVLTPSSLHPLASG